MAETSSRATGFLSRWSRLKRESAQSVVPKQPTPPAREETPHPATEALAAAPQTLEESPADAPAQQVIQAFPELPPIESLTIESDFTPFMQRKVPEFLRRQALKTLFRDPHFNQMDGLDIYIDDYTRFEPIPEEMLDKLSAWRLIKKPLEHVVSPEGHAVDVESEEGRAILAARAAAERETAQRADEPAGRIDAEPRSDVPAVPPAHTLTDKPTALTSPAVAGEPSLMPSPESLAAAQPTESNEKT
ncbi:MAG: DUF3306 domain-containing protein [Casimicrobiaceae bacterium]